MASYQGVLSRWIADRGFGFINVRVKGVGGQITLKSFFFHVTSISAGEPIEGCNVIFDLRLDAKKKDRLEATNIVFESTALVTPSALAGKDPQVSSNEGAK